MFLEILAAILITCFVCFFDYSSISLDNKTSKLLYFDENEEPDEKEIVTSEADVNANNSNNINPDVLEGNNSEASSELAQELDNAVADSEKRAETSVNIDEIADDFIEGVYDEFSSQVK